jgi:hypothetical protein
MACTRSAYLIAGGYEATKNSVTEDYAFFTNLVSQGGSFSHLCYTDVLVQTGALPTWDTWLAQRKRWFSGALRLPFLLQSPFWFQFSFYPLLIAVGVLFGWQTALCVWGVKVGGQSAWFGGYMIKLKLYTLLRWVVLYEFWFAFGAYALVWDYFRDKTIVWKGIEYPSNA